MKYIKSTDLRYKTSSIVSQLRDGESFYLIHRSEVVGEIVPRKKDKQVNKPFDPVAFKEFLEGLKPVPHLTDEERERNYRKHFEKKYGKYISRR